MYRTLTSPQGGRIILDGREVINMASNNYLGLANHPDVVAAAKDALEKYGVATTASRNICGNYPVHDELEEKLAKFKNVEAVLVFNCGVSANSGLRSRMEKECQKHGWKLYQPPLSLCGDNAAMVAAEGCFAYAYAAPVGSELNASAAD